MTINKLVIIVLLVGLIGLAVIFIFDPTHNFPSVSVTATLDPGENFTLHIPRYSAAQYAVSLWMDPYYWIATTMGGLELGNLSKVLIPEEIRGFLPVDDSGNLYIFNPTNESITSLLTGTRAPDPAKIGEYKAWWYMIFGIFEMIIASIIACIKPSPTVNIRPPADNSLATLTGNLQTKGRLASIRNTIVYFLTACCIRRNTSGAVLAV
jgi:hypothetical protein